MRPDEHPDPSIPPLPTLSSLRRSTRQHQRNAFAGWWLHNTPATYANWGLSAEPSPKELSLSRPTLHRLIAERSGHGDFATYHRRFNHPEAAANAICRCGDEMNPGHIFACGLTQATLRTLCPPGEEARHLLGPRGFCDFASLLVRDTPYARRSVDA